MTVGSDELLGWPILAGNHCLVCFDGKIFVFCYLDELYCVLDVDDNFINGITSAMLDNRKTIWNAFFSFVAIMSAFGTVVLIRAFIDRGDDGLVDVPFREVMGTFAQVVVVMEDGGDKRAAKEAGFEELYAVDDSMSDYNADSELSKLNRVGFDGPMVVSDELFEVVSAAVQYSSQTGGAFDITVGPLVELWRRAEKDKVKPTDEQIADAKAKVGYEKLKLESANKTVQFLAEGMLLDLGGIAKGYAIDKGIEAAKGHGAMAVMVDVGGDMMCYGKARAGGWKIGLQDPTADGEMLLVLKLNDVAVATSGNYRRFVVIGDERYSHIFRPKEGVSAGELTSVSVIAPTAIQADALATAVSVMGAEKGLVMIEGIAGVECMVISAGDESEILHTSGIGQYIDRVVSEQVKMIEFENDGVNK